MRRTLNKQDVNLNEVWKDVKGFEGFYQVSDLGRVKRIERRFKNSIPTKIIKQTQNGNGYLVVYLFNKRFLVHRLVACSFLPIEENKNIVNHKNGDKQDNRLINLEWSNNSDNMNHAYQLGLKISNKGQLHGRSKLQEYQVLEIKSSKKSISDLADFYNVSRSNISSILNGKSWKHLS